MPRDRGGRDGKRAKSRAKVFAGRKQRIIAAVKLSGYSGRRLAEKWKCTPMAVYGRARYYGVPMSPRLCLHSDAEILDAVYRNGGISEAARALLVSRSVLHRVIRERGLKIRPKWSSGATRLSAVPTSLLNDGPRQVVARRFGVNKCTLLNELRRRGVEVGGRPLESVPDSVLTSDSCERLSESLGVHFHTVMRERDRRGISLPRSTRY